jgi:hypothetical protein
MNLLLDFLCRFGWGLAAGLVLTPVALVPAGFFRVNLLVILGLATAAAVVASGLPDGGAAWLPAALAAVVAWLGSVTWLGEKTRAGRWASWIVAALLAAASLAVAAAAGPSGSLPGAWTAGGEALVSGLVSGLTVHAMLLGHWYLNAPGMRVDALRRMIDLALAAWAVQGVIALAGLVAGPGIPPGTTAAALLALRWLAGLVGLPVLLVMARKTLEIPNTQSATGILYVACLAAILGELTSQLLRAAA